jgi:hypothetical protein
MRTHFGCRLAVQGAIQFGMTTNRAVHFEHDAPEDDTDETVLIARVRDTGLSIFRPRGVTGSGKMRL